MAKEQKAADQKPPFSMEQAHQALDAYFDFLQGARFAVAFRWNYTWRKIEENITAVHELVKKLRQAKDFEEVLRVQMEFIQSQLSAFGMLAANLSEAHLKATADAAKRWALAE